jgi:hypothetical protein
MTNAFTIYLSLPRTSFSGVEAIDFCRRLGLPERANLMLGDAHLRDLITDVDEGFARAWFGPKQTQGHASVAYEWLAAGEMVEVEDRVWPGRFKLDITPERARELYVRARFEDLREELAHAEADLVEFREAAPVA